VITGRSDATLNRGGVRLGTSEIYSVVEELDEVLDSLVVHLEEEDELLLFVVPRPGLELDTELEARIKAALRDSLSPRHVPDTIVAVATIPRTLTGKKLEVPVKRILTGAKVSEVAASDALVDPGSIEPIAEFARSRSVHARDPLTRGPRTRETPKADRSAAGRPRLTDRPPDSP
jgi:acetoacetyl-CoA synthetase